MNSNKLTSPEKDDMIISKLVIRTVFYVSYFITGLQRAQQSPILIRNSARSTL